MAGGMTFGFVIWAVVGVAVVSSVLDAPVEYDKWVEKYPNLYKRLVMFILGGFFVWFIVGCSMIPYYFNRLDYTGLDYTGLVTSMKDWLEK